MVLFLLNKKLVGIKDLNKLFDVLVLCLLCERLLNVLPVTSVIRYSHYTLFNNIYISHKFKQSSNTINYLKVISR